jgi:2-polyprenyl-3-methyl-5-hydroxy-6-metoxy-1,4-benzoquinol methylase
LSGFCVSGYKDGGDGGTFRARDSLETEARSGNQMLQACAVDVAHDRPRFAFPKSGVDIYTCPTCGCIMADLEFAHEQYESANYYTMAFKTKAEIEGEWGFRWRYILNAIQRHTPDTRLLDVGAGNGYFVHLASNEFGLKADGLEISSAEADYARDTFGIELLRGDLSVVSRQYDVITSFNVLEHVKQPTGLLEDMHEKLRPGGLLVVTTPNPSCIHRRLRGLHKWNMVCPPHHINLFTKAALTSLLVREGFDILEYSTLSTYINAVRKIDTQGLMLRRAAFTALKTADLGADHFMICRARGQPLSS